MLPSEFQIEEQLPEGFELDLAPEGFEIEVPKKEKVFTKPPQQMAEDLMRQITGPDQQIPFATRHPNLYAAGQTALNMPQAIGELGEAVASGMTMGVSRKMSEAGEYLSKKLFGEGKKGGATGTWEKSVLPSYIETGGEMAGAMIPIGTAGKLIAAPIIKNVVKSKNLAPFARMIGWGAAGTAYTTAEGMIKEGELPTPGEMAKHGAAWAAFEGVISSLGWGGRLVFGVNKLSKTWNIPRKEILKTVMAEAKTRGMPIAKYAYAKAGVQKSLKAAEAQSAEKFVEGVEKLARKPFEKKGTYFDLVRRLKGEEISGRIKAFENFTTGQTTGIPVKSQLPKPAKPKPSDVAESTILRTGIPKPMQKKGTTFGFGPAAELQKMYERLMPKKLRKPAPKIPKKSMADLSPSTAVKKVMLAIKKAKPERIRQEAIYTKERGAKLAKSEAVGKKVVGEEGYYAEIGALKGEMTKVQFESIRKEIGQKDIDQLFVQIKDSPLLSQWEKFPARKGLAKLFGEYGGTVPTHNELSLLKEVFGQNFVKTVLSKRSLFKKIKEAGYNIASIPKSLMASYDVSAPLRQGLFLIGRPKQWMPAFKDMFKYLVSEKSYQGMIKEIKLRPNYRSMKKNKLALTDLSTNLSTREEAFMSSYAEKIPIIGGGVKASSRAYTGFLNRLRADVFDDFVKKGVKLGIKNPKYLKDAAKFINAATGRGGLGSLEGAAVPLNIALFSPRLMTSRLSLLNPVFYIKLQPEVRKEALKSLFTFAGTALSVAGLAKAGGSTSVGFDPRSADFMKLKKDNTRYDFLGGFQQPVRLAAQLIAGEIISTTTGKTLTLGEGYKPITRLGIMGRFLEYKEAPLVSFATGLLRGRTSLGEKFDLKTETENRFIPMVIQDMKDLYNEKGLEGIPLSFPAMFGVGVQTYGGLQSYGLHAKQYPKLSAELVRLKIGMGFPGTSVYGIELTNPEYKRFKEQAGKEIANTLTKIVSSPGYISKKDIVKIGLIEKEIDRRKEKVKIKLFKRKKRLSVEMKRIKKRMIVDDKEAKILAEKRLKSKGY